MRESQILALEEIKRNAKRSSMVPIITCYVKQFDKKNKPRYVILSVTDANICLWSSSNGLKKLCEGFWIDIKAIQVVKSLIEIKFKGSKSLLTFNVKNEDVRNDLGIVLKLATNDEFKSKFKKTLSNLTQYDLVVNGRALISRFYGYLISNKQVVAKEASDFIKKICKYRLRCVKVKNDSKIGKYFRYFLKAMEPNDYLEFMELPSKIETDVYKDLAHCIKDVTSLKCISFKTPPTWTFGKFCDTLGSMYDEPLYGIGFIEAGLKNKHLVVLSDAIIRSGIRNLLFQNTFNKKCKNVYNKFFSFNMMENIVSLNLDNTPKIDLKSLLSKCSNLRVISLVNTGLEVSFTLSILVILPNIKMINLSRNPCNYKFACNREYSSLFRLDLCKVRWKEGAFKSFCNWVSSSSLPYFGMLNLGFVDVPANELDEGFSFLEHMYINNIIYFGWENNIITDSVLRFLERSKNLSALNLTCVQFNSENHILRLADIIKTLPNIQNIIFRGSRSNNISKYIDSFLKSLRKCSKLMSLDLRYQKICDMGLMYLVQLLKINKSIKFIAFDGSNISSFRNLSSFLDHLVLLRRVVYVDWPSKDIERFESYGTIAPDDLISLKYKMSKICSHSDKKFYVVNENNNTNYFEIPFDCFKMGKVDSFPIYLTPVIEKLLEMEPEMILRHPNNTKLHHNQAQFYFDDSEFECVIKPAENENSYPNSSAIVCSSFSEIDKFSCIDPLPDTNENLNDEISIESILADTSSRFRREPSSLSKSAISQISKDLTMDTTTTATMSGRDDDINSTTSSSSSTSTTTLSSIDYE